MQIEKLAPEVRDATDNVTISISLPRKTLSKLDNTVAYLRDQKRIINRSKLIANIVDETLNKTTL